MFIDNTAATALANDHVSHSRTKHIEVRYRYIRQLVAFNKLRIQHLPKMDMLADVLTKPLLFFSASALEKGVIRQGIDLLRGPFGGRIRSYRV
jgi:hypothetical protein